MKEKYCLESKKELIKLLQKRDNKIEILENKVSCLERKLLAYENAHTPSSKQRFKKILVKKFGKIGAPEGHPKYERNKPKPNFIVKYSEENCIYCKEKLGLPTEIKSIIEEEIPNPQPVKVIEHRICIYFCKRCKKKIIARNNAPEGCFGKNLQSHVALFKFEDRLPLRKVESSLKRHYGITITNTGIYGITKRVARKLNAHFYDVIKIIRSAKIIYIDETEYKLNGKTWWLWAFVCEGAVLFLIRKSRSKEVIEEILGKKFDGIVVADGWKAYSQFAKILQRCWAHILRECDKLEENYKDFKNINEKIHKLFNEICEIRKDPPPEDKRKILQKKMKQRLEFIARNMLNDYRFKKLGKKILNGIDSWFTCVVYTDVEPTNNFAEQALRELIVQRKIMGGLRSEKGAVIMERITTCLASWKKQKKPLFETLRSYL
jgi:transposase